MVFRPDKSSLPLVVESGRFPRIYFAGRMRSDFAGEKLKHDLLLEQAGLAPGGS